jgi:hypothetical protein
MRKKEKGDCIVMGSLNKLPKSTFNIIPKHESLIPFTRQERRE